MIDERAVERTEQVSNDLRRYAEQHKIYEGMPLDQRLEVLDRVNKRSTEIKRELTDLFDISTFLEEMPDIKEAKVVRDQFSRDLLTHLRKVGDISYAKLVEGIPPEERGSYNRISLLKRANLVEYMPHPTDPLDKIIRVTERGRTIEY